MYQNADQTPGIRHGPGHVGPHTFQGPHPGAREADAASGGLTPKAGWQIPGCLLDLRLMTNEHSLWVAEVALESTTRVVGVVPRVVGCGPQGTRGGPQGTRGWFTRY